MKNLFMKSVFLKKGVFKKIQMRALNKKRS